jgi:hypothetical protein
MPSSARATTMAQSAVWPSTTMGFSAGDHPARPLAPGPGPHRAQRVAVPLFVQRHRAPLPPVARPSSSSSAPRALAARVAITADEKNGPGSGTRPICSRMMPISSSPAPSPGTSMPVHPSSTRRSQSSGVTPVGSSASDRRVSPPTSPMARRATSCRASCSASNVKSTDCPRGGIGWSADSVEASRVGGR